MSVIIGCPACKSRLTVKNLAKQSITCPKCKFQIVIDPSTIETSRPDDQPSKQAETVPASPPLDVSQPEVDLSLFSKPSIRPGISTIRQPVNWVPPVNPSNRSVPSAVTTAAAEPTMGNSVALQNDPQSQIDVPAAVKPNSQIPLAIPLRPRTTPTENIVATEGMSAALAAPTNVTASQNAGDLKLDDPGLSGLQLTASSAESVHANILKRKKRQRMFFFVTNSMLALITMAIAGALYWQLTRTPGAAEASSSSEDSKQSDALADAPPTAAADTPKSSETSKSSETEEPDATATPPTTAQTAVATEPLTDLEPATPTVLIPPDPPRFSFFSRKQVNEIWKSTKPNMVSLQIDSAAGRQKAVGLIVDSRGWILTSHQAVKEATRIEVTAATEPLTEPPAGIPPLVDLVRGHIANDPANDLAILAINRRFVVSLAEPEFIDKDRLVEQVRLLTVAPPSATNYYGFCEVFVEQRNTVAQLPLATRSKLNLLGIGTPDLSWITLSGETEWLPGMPLLDQGGKVQAMVSFSLENNRSLAVSLAPLADLLRNAPNEVKPLKINLAKTDAEETVLVDEGPPTQKSAVALNAAASRCRDFGWLPQTNEHYRVLVDFLKHYVASRDLIAAYDNDYRDDETTKAGYRELEQLTGKLGDELKARVRQALEEDKASIDKLNQFAEKQIEKGTKTLVPFFGKVTEGGLQVDRFIVQLDGLETHCVIPFDPTARTLRPGTLWLLIVETSKSNRPKAYKIGDNRTIQAYSALQKTEFGPLNPRKQAERSNRQ